ncbi:hypothetical protein W59_11541 [Rhodococcus opacus RKJ300 = JCM 13270]|nr:hypothetical protein W59_11541 [Rhodococcus opacus RKJ300 = JCM 13270]QQZ19725.1 pentapeptide repeat-containing protein [Rhodococcus sp. 21391]
MGPPRCHEHWTIRRCHRASPSELPMGLPRLWLTPAQPPKPDPQEQKARIAILSAIRKRPRGDQNRWAGCRFDLSSADLPSADLSGADLLKATLTHADLTDVFYTDETV